FRADDGELDVLLGEVGQLLQGQHVDGDVLALGLERGAGIARSDEDLLYARILRDLPGQGVFATAAADDEYVHKSLLRRELQASGYRLQARAETLLPAACSLQPAALLLMPEVAHTGEHHCDSSLVGGGDHFVVTHGTARLDHGGDAGLGRVVDAVTEGEEGVGSHDRAL